MFVWLTLVAALVALRLFFGNLADKRRQAAYLAIAGTMIAVVMGLRYAESPTNRDLYTYYTFYSHLPEMSWPEAFAAVSRFDPGYVVFNKLLASVAPWPQTIVLVEAAVAVFATMYYVYKNSDSPFLGSLFYLTIGALPFHLSGFRQTFAMSICLLGVECIKKKRPVAFIAVVLLAASFHRSAIVFLPAYLLIDKKPSLTRAGIGLVLTVVAAYGAELIAELGNSFMDTGYSASYAGSQFGGLVPIAIYAIAIILSLRHRKKLQPYIGVNMAAIGVSIYVLRYLALVLQRISYYFLPGVLIALPEGIAAEEDKHLRALLQLAAVSLSIALFAYRIGSEPWGPYLFFWQ